MPSRIVLSRKGTSSSSSLIKSDVNSLNSSGLAASTVESASHQSDPHTDQNALAAPSTTAQASTPARPRIKINLSRLSNHASSTATPSPAADSSSLAHSHATSSAVETPAKKKAKRQHSILVPARRQSVLHADDGEEAAQARTPASATGGAGGEEAWEAHTPGVDVEDTEMEDASLGADTSQQPRQRKMKQLKRKPLKQALERVLTQLQKRDTYQFFCYPVDESEVPTYRSVISKPMDFQTMQNKLEAEEYRTPEQFKDDLLLVMTNAQTFNPPGSIYSNEAKRIEAWGIRALDREGSAAILPAEEEAAAAAQAAEAEAEAAAAAAATRGARIPKGVSANEVQVKTEYEEQGEEDWEGSEGGATSSSGDESRDHSMSVEPSRHGSFRAESSRLGSPEVARRRYGPRASQKGRKSARNKLHSLGFPGLPSLGSPATPRSAGVIPGLATTGAANVSDLTFVQDGSVDVDALELDQRRALLQPLGLDGEERRTNGMLLPTLDALDPIHPAAQLQASALLRPVADTINPFTAAIRPAPYDITDSASHDLSRLPAEQRCFPYLVPSGWGYPSTSSDPQRGPDVPLVWPKPTVDAPGEPENEKGERKIGKDRDKERDEKGMANVDDWTYNRQSVSRLVHPLDFALYPGLLPSVWQSHIQTIKGGPERNRLPPFHLTSGSTYETALRSELDKVVERSLYGRSQPPTAKQLLDTSTLTDVVESIVVSMEQQLKAPPDARNVAALKGQETLRRLVWRSTTGEAYARSVAEFVSGAAGLAGQRDAVRVREDAEEAALDEAEKREEQDQEKREEAETKRAHLTDDMQREGGFALFMAYHGVERDVFWNSDADKPDSRERSRSKLDRSVRESPMDIEADGRATSAPSYFGSPLLDAAMRGTILDRPLQAWVRDEVISPITGRTLDVLARAGALLEAAERAQLGGTESSTTSQRPGLYTNEEDSSISFDDLDFTLLGAEGRAEPEISTAWLQQSHIEAMLRPGALVARARARDVERAAREEAQVQLMIRSSTELYAQVHQDHDVGGSSPDTPTLRYTDQELEADKIDRMLRQYARLVPALSDRALGRRLRSTKLQSGATTGSAEQLRADAEEHRRDAKLWDDLRLGYIALARNIPGIALRK